MGQADEQRYIRSTSGISDKDAASFQVLYERLMAIYGNPKNGVAEAIAIGNNAALAMWPDPGNAAQNTLVANAAEDRKNGRIVIELFADYFPFGGPVPPLVLNLLYAAVQANCGMGVGPQDIAVVHANNFTVFVYMATTPDVHLAVARIVSQWPVPQCCFGACRGPGVLEALYTVKACSQELGGIFLQFLRPLIPYNSGHPDLPSWPLVRKHCKEQQDHPLDPFTFRAEIPAFWYSVASPATSWYPTGGFPLTVSLRAVGGCSFR